MFISLKLGQGPRIFVSCSGSIWTFACLLFSNFNLFILEMWGILISILDHTTVCFFFSTSFCSQNKMIQKSTFKVRKYLLAYNFIFWKIFKCQFPLGQMLLAILSHFRPKKNFNFEFHTIVWFFFLTSFCSQNKMIQKSTLRYREKSRKYFISLQLYFLENI